MKHYFSLQYPDAQPQCSGGKASLALFNKDLNGTEMVLYNLHPYGITGPAGCNNDNQKLKSSSTHCVFETPNVIRGPQFERDLDVKFPPTDTFNYAMMYMSFEDNTACNGNPGVALGIAVGHCFELESEVFGKLVYNGSHRILVNP